MAEETTRNPQARRFALHSTMTYDLLNPLLNLDSLDDSSQWVWSELRGNFWLREG